MKLPTFTSPFGLALGAALLLGACGDNSDDGNADAGTTSVADTGTTPTDGGTTPTDAGPVDMGVEPECRTNAECSGTTPYCDTTTGMCAAPPRAGALGWGDGSTGSVDLFLVEDLSQRAAQATDLEFSKANPNELWVIHREVPADAPCTQRNTRGCFALQGSTSTIRNPGEANEEVTWIQDFNAWHFMRRPPAIAFGVVSTAELTQDMRTVGFENFGVCGDERTGNFLDDTRADFIGPSLYNTSPQIYRNYSSNERPSGENGTHMDMLHASPFCMGIAHDQGNAFWVANGQRGSLDWYDFARDHGVGAADHSDGRIMRHELQSPLSKVQWVPGHLTVHNGVVYAADTGNGRVISYDPSGATMGGGLTPQYEPLAESGTMTGGTEAVVVASGGVLQQPSGLEIHEDILYVSDWGTGQIHAFELDGTLIRSLDTGLGAEHLAGLAFGPSDGKLYFVDVPTSQVLRVDPR